ncbi:MAG: TadE/TadG family type IV pilus assembly protein [Marmoricola sp.]
MPYRRTEGGAAAVETALCLCFVVLPLLFGIISWSYMLSFRQAVSQAAAEGARASVGAPSTSTPCATPTATKPDPTAFTAAGCPQQYYAAQAVHSALDNYGMSCGVGYLTCTIAAASAVNCAVGHTCMTVTVTYPYRAHSLLPTIPGFGFTLPPDITVTSTVEVS